MVFISASIASLKQKKKQVALRLILHCTEFCMLENFPYMMQRIYIVIMHSIISKSLFLYHIFSQICSLWCIRS